VLAVTKQTAQDVSDKLANASETNNKINEACEEYRPVAHRATLIYFLIAEFSVVNCMYQTSLAQFNELYEKSIDASEKANMPSKRIANIIEHMTYEIYLYIQVRLETTGQTPEVSMVRCSRYCSACGFLVLRHATDAGSGH
jgi:dynein heavy chain